MSFEYIGPRTLKGVVREEYEKIADHYPRESPRIIIGYPGPFDYNINCRAINFRSQDDFNSYVDSIMRNAQERLRRKATGKPRKSGDRKFLREVDKLKRVSFAMKDEKKGYALYNILEDAVYLDARILAAYQMDRSGSPHPVVDAASHLKHELVHQSLGDCDEYAPVRHVFREMVQTINDICHGEKKVPQGLFDRKNQELKALEEPILMRIRKFGIKIVDEALAYIFGGGEQSFFRWLSGIDMPGAQSAGKQVFQHLRSMVDDSPESRRSTIIMVRDAMNTAFRDEVSCIDILLNR